MLQKPPAPASQAMCATSETHMKGLANGWLQSLALALALCGCGAVERRPESVFPGLVIRTGPPPPARTRNPEASSGAVRGSSNRGFNQFAVFGPYCSMPLGK